MSNLSYSTQLIEQDDIDGIIEVLKGSFLAQGPKVAKFEEDLSNYVDAPYVIAFNSATSALSAVYSVLGVSAGDEVITTPISFVATSNMFVNLGATPVWCDVKPDGNIDENRIEELITPKTKAIVPVHFAGKPVNMTKILQIAKKHNLLVIEDAAHALGSSYKSKKVGSLSDITIFSFHAIKPITTGEGGAVSTHDKELVQKLRLFRSHGMQKKELWESDMTEMGHNLRLTEVAAALGISQLKKLDDFIKLRNEIACYYDDRFKDVTLFQTTIINNEDVSTRHLYPVILEQKLLAFKKEIFKDLQQRGLGVQVHYKPIYQNSYYKEKFGTSSLKNADDFYAREISIPCHHNMNMEDAKFVADTLIEIINRYSSF